MEFGVSGLVGSGSDDGAVHLQQNSQKHLEEAHSRLEVCLIQNLEGRTL